MNLLVSYSHTAMHVTAVYDYVAAFKKYWKGEVRYLHVTNDAIVGQDISNFQVLLHNYCARLCFDGHVSEYYKQVVRQFGGLKILVVQDEYDRTNILKREIKNLGFHIVLTLIPQDQIELVFPKQEFPHTKFVTVLAGYMNDAAPGRVEDRRPLQDRPILIGYRGRNIDIRYGQLGYEKYDIGRRMKMACIQHDIPFDIAMEEEDRIYGTAWKKFIQSCRAMLGTESGANVFDFDGKLEKRFAGKKCGDVDAQTHLAELAEYEKQFDIGQISPRAFECAANFTPMILYEGRYSGVLVPDEHYIELKKDFSNFPSVLSKLQDLTYLEKLATRTNQHLLGSKRFSYRSFVESVQTEAIEVLAELNKEFHLGTSKLPPVVEVNRDMLPAQMTTEMPKRGLDASIEEPYRMLQHIILNLREIERSYRNAILVSLGAKESFRAYLRYCRIVWFKRMRFSGSLVVRLALMLRNKVRGIADNAEKYSDFVKGRWQEFAEARRVRDGFSSKDQFLRHAERECSSIRTELERMEALIAELRTKQPLAESDVDEVKAAVSHGNCLARGAVLQINALLL